MCGIFSNRYYPIKNGDAIDCKDVEIENNDENEVTSALEEATKCSSRNIPNYFHSISREIIYRFKDIFASS